MIKTLNSEEGSVVLLVVMILMLVTMFGFSALNSADTELIISQNERCYKQNFYRAEGAVLEAGQVIEGLPGVELKPDTSAQIWLSDGTDASTTFNPETIAWTYGSNSSYSNFHGDNASGYTVVFNGLAPGASGDMTVPQVWQYSLYGKSELCTGELAIVAGYRKRF